MKKIQVLLLLIAGLSLCTPSILLAQDFDRNFYEEESWDAEFPTEPGTYIYDGEGSWIDIGDATVLEEVVVEGEPWPVLDDGNIDAWMHEGGDYWKYYDEYEHDWHNDNPYAHYGFEGGGFTGGGFGTGGSGASGSYGVFKTPFTKNNYRHNLVVLTDRNPSDEQAHHVFPQKYRDIFSDKDIGIDSPYFLVWWETKDHNENAYRYNRSWEEFFDRNPDASREDILDHGRITMEEDHGIPVNF